MSVIFWIEGDRLESLIEHPLCKVVPPSMGVSAERTRSITQPIVLLDNMIIDGRARRREAVRLRLRCPAIDYENEHQWAHPALLLAHENRHRLTKPQRAVLAARLVKTLQRKPVWLVAHDLGFTERLSTRDGRRILLQVLGISERNYQRAYGMHHEDLLQAAFDERVSLDHAFRMRELVTATRRRIIELPRPEQKPAIDAALERMAKRHVPLGHAKKRRTKIFFSWSLCHELGKYMLRPARKGDGYVRPPTGDDDDE